MELLLNLLNRAIDPLVIAIVGFGFLASITPFVLMVVKSISPQTEEKWRAWEGTIITAVRLAEQSIPDTVSNAGLAKLDAALKYVLEVYASSHSGDLPPVDVVESIKQGIQIIHNDLDQAGQLTKK